MDNKYTNNIKRALKRELINEFDVFLCICNALISGLNAFVFHNEVVMYMCIVLLIITTTIFGYLRVTE